MGDGGIDGEQFVDLYLGASVLECKNCQYQKGNFMLYDIVKHGVSDLSVRLG
jgi:hypothetical protein